MEKKALLFDMDGVLVDSEALHFEAHRRALEKVGFKLDKEDYLQNGISGGKKHFYEMLSEKYNFPIDIELARKTKIEEYGKLIPEIKIIDGVKEVLEKLKEKYRMAIASTTHLNYIHQTLQHVGIEEYFEAFSSAKDMERGKPFPDVYLDVMKQLNISPERCVGIEDSENGVQAVKSAGVKCIAIPGSFTDRQDFSEADVILKNIKGLDSELIDGLLK